MENRILDIKLKEEDYTKILTVLVVKIAELNKQLNNTTNQEDLLNEIYKLKLLVAKLEEAKLYNQ